MAPATRPMTAPPVLPLGRRPVRRRARALEAATTMMSATAAAAANALVCAASTIRAPAIARMAPIDAAIVTRGSGRTPRARTTAPHTIAAAPRGSRATPMARDASDESSAVIAPAARASWMRPAPHAAIAGTVTVHAIAGVRRRASCELDICPAQARRPRADVLRSAARPTPSSTMALARCRKWSNVLRARMFAAVPTRKNPTTPSRR